ncbi:MAG: hypothetical protein LBU32_09520 [Clostridiales bacterium]|nr:hypothetical protein [Clostridiales bacterium]
MNGTGTTGSAEDGRQELKPWSNAPARRSASGRRRNGAPAGGAGGARNIKKGAGCGKTPGSSGVAFCSRPAGAPRRSKRSSAP